MKTNLLSLLALHLGLAAVVAQPVITQPPQDQTALLGGTAAFTVEAVGFEPLTYQWRTYSINGSFRELPGATNSTLTLLNVQYTDEVFAVAITDMDGSSVVSEPWARLTVLGPPKIASGPRKPSAVEGESYEMSVAALGTEPLTYQWQFNGEFIWSETSGTLVLDPVLSNNAGEYSVVVENSYGSVTGRVATLTVVPPTLFMRVTNGPVATMPRQGTGAVWADFNNDGWLDLYAPDYEAGANLYFRNNGNGDFTLLPQDASMNTGRGSLGTSAVDYDNDGYLDLVVSSAGVEPIPLPNSLFHNNGDGTFTRVTAGGLGSTAGHFFATDWADYDNDGFLDAVITGPGPPLDDNGNSLGGTNQLWHNNGDGTFTRIASGPIATDVGFAWGALWFDYDSDGRPDLLTLNIYNGGWTNYLYHNEGNGTFTRNLTSPIGTDFLSGGCEGADWGDYDNDGLLDLFVADSGGVRSHLYHNQGGGSFSNVATGPMLTPPVDSQPHGATWGDYDNDGYLDLLVVHADRNLLYRNSGDGTFSEVRLAGLAGDTVSGNYFFNNVSWVDYDNDGFLDLHFCLGRGVGQPDPLRPNYLYHNGGNSNGWLEVKCVGTVANRSAIGTRIRARATLDGKPFWQVRELKSSAGWDVAAPLVAHFGLGDATNVETLRIEWPSGTVQELTNVTPRQILKITEPPRLAVQIGAQRDSIRLQISSWPGFNLSVEQSADLTTWELWRTVTSTNRETYIDTPLNGPAEANFFRLKIP
jgi:hypothetical protein